MTEIMRHHVRIDCGMFSVFASDGIAMPFWGRAAGR